MNKNKDYKWAKDYQKRGFEVFDQNAVAILRRIQNKYASDFIAYFAGFSNIVDKDVGDFATKSVQRIVLNLGRVLGSGGRKATNTDMSTLKSEINSLSTTMQTIKSVANSDNDYAVKIGALESESGMSFEELYATHKHVSSILEKYRAKNEVTSKSKAISDIGEFGGNLAKDMLNVVAGPFAPLLTAVGGFAGHAIDDVKERMKEAKAKKNFELLMPKSEFYAENFVNEYESKKSGRARLPSHVRGYDNVKDQMLYADKPTNIVKQTAQAKSAGIFNDSDSLIDRMTKAENIGMFDDNNNRNVRTNLIREPRMFDNRNVRTNLDKNDETKTSLFEFFDKTAFKAKWTKDVYSFLKKGKNNSDNFDDMFGKAMDGVGSFLASAGEIALALAGIGTLVAAIMVIKKWIDEKFPGQTSFAEMTPAEKTKFISATEARGLEEHKTGEVKQLSKEMAGYYKSAGFMEPGDTIEPIVNAEMKKYYESGLLDSENVGTVQPTLKALQKAHSAQARMSQVQSGVNIDREAPNVKIEDSNFNRELIGAFSKYNSVMTSGFKNLGEAIKANATTNQQSFPADYDTWDSGDTVIDALSSGKFTTGSN